MPPIAAADFGTVQAVALSGPDARRFANGMFTNNVRDLAAGCSQRTGLTDDRGRLWALAELYAVSDDTFWMVLDGQSVEAFVERYEKYVVFDDVELTPLQGLRLLTVQGEGAQHRLGVPAPEMGCLVGVPGGWLIGRDRGARGFDVLVAEAESGAWLERLGSSDTGAIEVDALRILARQVTMADVVPPGLPHEHGLREGILHFEKGCYLGQESIHRIDVMGNPRRALALVRGDDVVVGDLTSADGKVAGRVTSRCAHPGGGSAGLAVVRKPDDEPGALLVGANGHPVETQA